MNDISYFLLERNNERLIPKAETSTIVLEKMNVFVLEEGY